MSIKQEPIAKGQGLLQDRREGVQIILLGVGAAVVYGILQDQVTAHVCVEYFTIGHIDYLNLKDPALIAFEWGVAATWWVGLPLGTLLAISARAGRRRPKLTTKDLLRPTLLLMVSTGALALVAGMTGYFAARSGAAHLLEPLATLVPKEKQVAFLADLWAHTAAYAVGCIGAIVVCLWAWRKRRKLEKMQIAQEQVWDQMSAEEHGERMMKRGLIVVGGVGLVLGILSYIALQAVR